ncbi:MAG: rhodanese-like domain-containing protein [bacterium]|nr:rhodanese-like domain-containing protein [bacterium]
MPKGKVSFISKEQLFEMLENEEPLTLVEVLPEERYRSGHLPKAITIPLQELEARAAALLPDRAAPIVVYCSSFLCTASTGAARLLQSMGYIAVRDYKGGKEDWTKAGLPLVTE